tara:strand:+ start:1163 stop:2707 length:1545 start_codon:yes stop_codon:yes gene_type:complete
MQHMFPRITQCPSTGHEGRSYSPGRGVFCKKCMHFGEINKNDHPNSSLWTVDKPCTICAMSNNGFWGWDSEENFGKKEHLINENGILPGKCGIMDTLLGSYDMVDTTASDEQIILGFVQYALYNHMKWKDIIPYQQLDTTIIRRNIEPYQVRWSAFDTSQIEDEGETDDIWYWWKMIPKGIVLPERLHRKLMLMIVEYPDGQHFNCIPKTRQKLTEGISDDVWTTFWDTYVEPAHVVHIFQQVLTTVLEKIISGPNSPYTSYNIHSVSTYNELVSINRDRIDNDDFQWMLDRWQRNNGNSNTFYLYCKRYPIVDENGIPFYDGIIKIFDRNIFGTYLSDVTYYNMELERLWNSERGLRQRIFPEDVYEQDTTIISDDEMLQLWGNISLRMFNGLLQDANSFINFQVTNYWETAIRDLPEHELYIYSDYSNENLFRLVENSDILGLNYYVQYFENSQQISSDDTESEVSINTEEIIHKLKELQTMIDEKVKENVPEGVYLELVNQTYQIFKIIKE